MNHKLLTLGVVLFSLLFLSACENSSDSMKLDDVKIELPEPESSGGKLYKQFCSACHAPPRIASHKADEWLNIIERMQNHRVMKAYNPLNDLEKKTLVTYLEKYSAN